MSENPKNNPSKKRFAALGQMLYRILSGFVVILLAGFAMFAVLLIIMHFI